MAASAWPREVNTGRKSPPFVAGSAAAPALNDNHPEELGNHVSDRKRGERRADRTRPVLGPARKIRRHGSGIGESGYDDRSGAAERHITGRPKHIIVKSSAETMAGGDQTKCKDTTSRPLNLRFDFLLISLSFPVPAASGNRLPND